jgi:hypothetical protein
MRLGGLFCGLVSLVHHDPHLQRGRRQEGAGGRRGMPVASCMVWGVVMCNTAGSEEAEG